MAIGLHDGGPMLVVWNRLPFITRCLAVSCWLLILFPMMAGAQTPTVTAIWDASPPSDQVSYYEVCIGTTSMSCNVQLTTVNVSQTSLQFSPTPGRLHYVAVRAVNTSGSGAYSTEASFSIPSVAQLTNRTTALNTL